ncbi:VOC family protein [Luminiphilus sp.]|nr:VOC family protein [Luminiphilus sp.]
MKEASASIAFHHPGLVVPDIDRARDFYTRALGYVVVKTFDWDQALAGEPDMSEQVTGISGTSARCLILKNANSFLELFQYQSPEPEGNPMERRACDPGIAHLAFQVADMEHAYRRFTAAGGLVHNEPVRVGEGWSIYCRDPFGNIIELMQVGSDEPDFDLVEEKLLPAGRELK